MRQLVKQNWYWVLVGIPVLGAILYSYYRRADLNYWDDAIGNWLATMLGIIVGVPVALQIERWRASREEQKRVAEARDRAKAVLSLIADELRDNAARLRVAQSLEDKDSLPLSPFKNDVWEALCDSGEIKWIDNPLLLGEIASTYYLIGVVLSIEEKCYQTLRGINVTYSDGTSASQRLLEDARKFDVEMEKSISRVLEAIKDAIAQS